MSWWKIVKYFLDQDIDVIIFLQVIFPIDICFHLLVLYYRIKVRDVKVEIKIRYISINSLLDESKDGI